ncbi:hypothetical protein AMR41_08170 [Hapalosiphon sp. MRB220]|nr:hypothetical protein AMR41_08170 [Hapalosiphon sp. MRB220]
MEQRIAGWRACPQGRGQGATGQRGRAFGSQRPAQQATGVAIHHRSQVAPLAGDFEVGDIADPDLVGSIARLFVGTTGDAVQEARQAGTSAIEAGRAGAYAFLPHQSFHPAAPHGLALAPEGGMHAGTAIGVPAGLMYPTNLLHQAGIFDLAVTARSPRPCVVAGGADPVETAHRPHRTGFLVVLDEGEDLAFRSEVNAIAFFKRSCSSLSCSYCRLILRSAFSSAAVDGSTGAPLVTITPSRASLRQRDSM